MSDEACKGWSDIPATKEMKGHEIVMAEFKGTQQNEYDTISRP